MTSLTGRKRITSVITEAFQNAVNHGAGRPTVRLKTEGDHCIVATSNRILNGDREKIIKRLEEINGLDHNMLKNRYLEAIQQPATQKSCGLGLLAMRRKSGYPLEFNFTEIDTLHTHFFLRVRVRFR